MTDDRMPDYDPRDPTVDLWKIMLKSRARRKPPEKKKQSKKRFGRAFKEDS